MPPPAWIIQPATVGIVKYPINDNKVSTTISEKMDYLVPAAKIADMATGWLAGQAARDFTATDDRMLNHFDIDLLHRRLL